jgi:hypothetical protein
VDYAAAFALALAGDLAQSRALAQVLAREFPEDTSVQFMYLPTLRALFSLNTPTPDAAAAIQAVQTASRYDLALGRRVDIFGSTTRGKSSNTQCGPDVTPVLETHYAHAA